jgi:hypothetical protein
MTTLSFLLNLPTQRNTSLYIIVSLPGELHFGQERILYVISMCHVFLLKKTLTIKNFASYLYFISAKEIDDLQLFAELGRKKYWIRKTI